MSITINVAPTTVPYIWYLKQVLNITWALCSFWRRNSNFKLRNIDIVHVWINKLYTEEYKVPDWGKTTWKCVYLFSLCQSRSFLFWFKISPLKLCRAPFYICSLNLFAEIKCKTSSYVGGSVAQLLSWQVFMQCDSPDVDSWKLTGVILLQVVVWQKAKVADHRSALIATLGPSAVANLLPCHHHQEQPEVS